MLFINIIVFISILFFIEIAIRISFNITPQGLSKGIIFDSKNLKFNYPNINNKKVFGKSVFTDNNGFRISKRPMKKKNLSGDIYFVGGSVTFGSGVIQSKTFSGILEEKINYHKIFNASVIGSNLRNNLEIINNKITTNNLKNIFINFSLDDIENLNENIKTDDPPFQLKDKIKENNESKISNLVKVLKKNKLLNYLNNFIRSKSVTYVLIKGYFLNSNERYYQYALRSFNEENIKSLNFFMKKYKKKNEIINKKIIFLVIPYSFQINDENCKKNDIAERTIEKEIKLAKIKLIKFKNLFCNDMKKNKIFLKYDPSHLSEYGHSIVANVLEKEIM